MRLIKVIFGARPENRYFFRTQKPIETSLKLQDCAISKELESQGSSNFFLGRDNLLAKVVPDKYDRSLKPFKWLFRDYLEKRVLLQLDARKEFRSLQIIKRAGLNTPICYGWGVSINPFNTFGSIFLMEFLEHATPGKAHFYSLTQSEQIAFLDLLCEEIAVLAKFGFTHRDLHLNNLMVSKGGCIIWIDTHIRQLPSNKAKRWKALSEILKPSKLEGSENCQYMTKKLRSLLDISSPSQ
jgi:hypothetical protein